MKKPRIDKTTSASTTAFIKNRTGPTEKQLCEKGVKKKDNLKGLPDLILYMLDNLPTGVDAYEVLGAHLAAPSSKDIEELGSDFKYSDCQGRQCTPASTEKDCPWGDKEDSLRTRCGLWRTASAHIKSNGFVRNFLFFLKHAGMT